MRIKIAPSILSADFSRLGEEIKLVEPEVDMLHIDVMDGHFVPNLTIGVPVVKSIRKMTDLALDVHLMITNPMKFVKPFADAGADIITVHAESVHWMDALELIRREGKKTGVSISPPTSTSFIEPVLGDVDMALVMSVNPGFSGQSFMPEAVPKISRLRGIIEKDKLDTDIQVDGGISPTTAPQVVEAGANVLVAGSAIFGAEEPLEVIKQLKAGTGEAAGTVGEDTENGA